MDNNEKTDLEKRGEIRLVRFIDWLRDWLVVGYRLPLVIIVCGAILMLAPFIILLSIILGNFVERLWHGYCYHTSPDYQIAIAGLVIVFIGVISIPVIYFLRKRSGQNVRSK